MNRIGMAMMLGLAAGVAGPALAQDAAPVSGMIVGGPPTEVMLEVRGDANGVPVLSQSEFKLVLGSYYRFHFSCPDVTGDVEPGFHFESPRLMENIHLRIIAVNQMEVYMQGSTFRALECDGTGEASFNFNPMRKGTYDILVRDHSDPPKEAHGKFIVE